MSIVILDGREDLIPHLLPLMDWIFLNKPELGEKISKNSEDWIDALCILCAEPEVGIMLDDCYASADLIRLINIVGDKLRLGSTLIIPFNALGNN
jgi:hypothetical protein